MNKQMVDIEEVKVTLRLLNQSKEKKIHQRKEFYLFIY